MSPASWPYLPGQCPRCHYFHALDPGITDDAGYELPGFCLHARIGMELFRTRQLKADESERCPLFLAQVRSARR